MPFTSLSANELHPDSPLTSSFRTFPTSHSNLPNSFCITSKSSHSCQCSTSLHQLCYIFHHSYQSICFFHSSPMLLTPPCFSTSTVTPKYLYSSTSHIQQSPIIHLPLPTSPFMHTTVDFFSFTFKPYSITHSFTCSMITSMSSSLLAIKLTSSAYINPAWLFHFMTPSFPTTAYLTPCTQLLITFS